MVFYFRFSFIGYWYFYIVGGGKLVSLGGSWYFLISGLFITISAISIFRKSAGRLDFCGCFVGTVIWSLIDAGWEFWPLFSRLMFPAGLFAALLFTLPSIRRYQFQTSLASSAYAVGGLVVVGMLIALYQMFQPHPTVASSGEKLPLVPVDPSKNR